MITKNFYILFAALLMAFATSCTEFAPKDEPSTPGTPEQPGNPDTPSVPTESGVVITEGAVDLGLSVKWAACNLGTEYCYKVGKSYKWGDQRTDCLLDICGTTYDQATAELGEGWQLPSYEQAKELTKKCHWKAGQYRGENGYIVTGPSGNAIFIPFYYYYGNPHGYLWTGTCDVTTNQAYYMHLSTHELELVGRNYERYIRPVYVGS